MQVLVFFTGGEQREIGGHWNIPIKTQKFWQKYFWFFYNLLPKKRKKQNQKVEKKPKEMKKILKFIFNISMKQLISFTWQIFSNQRHRNGCQSQEQLTASEIHILTTEFDSGFARAIFSDPFNLNSWMDLYRITEMFAAVSRTDVL